MLFPSLNFSQILLTTPPTQLYACSFSVSKKNSQPTKQETHVKETLHKKHKTRNQNIQAKEQNPQRTMRPINL